MRIYVGTIFADLTLAPRNDIPVFEDLFKDKTGTEYADCWSRLFTEPEIICKTSDAVKCAPPHAMVVRVGRSIRKSDFGQIIETEMSLAEYLFTDTWVSVDRRSPD